MSTNSQILSFGISLGVGAVAKGVCSNVIYPPLRGGCRKIAPTLTERVEKAVQALRCQIIDFLAKNGIEKELSSWICDMTTGSFSDPEIESKLTKTDKQTALRATNIFLAISLVFMKFKIDQCIKSAVDSTLGAAMRSIFSLKH
jgi:hypothetical protein